MTSFKEKLTKIKAFVLDVDGVMSSATQVLSADGETVRSANLKDGFAILAAVHKGYHFGIITGGCTIEVVNRCKKYGISDVYNGSLNKVPSLLNFLEKYGLDADEIVYMGDDLPDYQPMMKAGVAVCPKDAAPEIKSISNYISDHNGGEGCVRDIIEQVMRAQGTWIDAETMDWSKFWK